MKKIVVELSNERMITPSSLTLVGAMLGKSGLVRRCNHNHDEKPFLHQRSRPSGRDRGLAGAST